MKWFADVLDKFTPKERIFVLILLMVFSSFVYLGSNYFNSDKYDELSGKYEELSFKYIELMNTDSCAPLREQNKQLLNDFVVVSNIIRTYRDMMEQSTTQPIVSMMRYPPAMIDNPNDSIRVSALRPPPEVVYVNDYTLLEEMLNTLTGIVEQNIDNIQ
jgi:hypothetical protein